MSTGRVLVYLVRHDLRVSDNPILHHLASTPDHGFTHLLPVFTFEPHQTEVSGFLKDGKVSPYPEARSRIGKFWRCGPHRAKFIGQSVWNLKQNLQKLGSGLSIQFGWQSEVLQSIDENLKDQGLELGAVWMCGEEGSEEKSTEKSVSKFCSDIGAELRIWNDEKYFIDDRDLTFESPSELPDVFTTYRKMMEPLREKPRPTLPAVAKGSLPPLIDIAITPRGDDLFELPSSGDAIVDALIRPLKDAFPSVPPFPEGAESAHPFEGGEDYAKTRLDHLLKSGKANSYKNTRNGLLGSSFSTKLSAYLAQGCITARQVHEALLRFEDGTDEAFAGVDEYGQGDNEGTKAIRFELLWRDYMRLCTRKFEAKLFRRSGFSLSQEYTNKWKSPNPNDKGENQKESAEEVAKTLQRIWEGSTGMGLIDASQRELIYTGYTSNRARQNVASFLAKHLGIDWRYGAEWYEMCLVDYDVSSNWANWQYVSGVGNDPRGEARIFNPVKQAFDYDKEGEYVRCWVPELRQIENLENLFQVWTTPKEHWETMGLKGLTMAEYPVKKIEFSVDGKPKSSRRPFARRRGQASSRGNANDQPPKGPQTNGTNKDIFNQPRSSPQFTPNGNFGPAFHGGRGGGTGRGGRGGPRGGRGFGSVPYGSYRGGGRGPWQPAYPRQMMPQPQPQWGPTAGPMQ